MKQNINIQTEPYLTVQETAQLLRTTKQLIYSLIKDGKLKAVQLSPRKTLISQIEIDNLITQSEIKPR